MKRLFAIGLSLLMLVGLSADDVVADSEFSWWQRITGADKDPCTQLNSREITALRPSYGSSLKKLSSRHKASTNAFFYKMDLKLNPLEAKIEYLVSADRSDAADKLMIAYQKLMAGYMDALERLQQRHEREVQQLCQKMFPRIY